MAVDKVVDSTQLDADLTSVANAIRAKSGGSGSLAFPAGFVSEIGNIPSGNFTLIGTKVITNLEEYTDTATTETLDTEIDISNTDYAWGYIVVTCDSAITTSTEWGMSVCLWGRYTSNSAIMGLTCQQQKGSATLSKAAMVSASFNTSAYGVWQPANTNTVQICRKAHGTACPKIRAGNYTVKVYGMTAF